MSTIFYKKGLKCHMNDLLIQAAYKIYKTMNILVAIAFWNLMAVVDDVIFRFSVSGASSFCLFTFLARKSYV